MSSDREVMGTCTCRPVELYRECIKGRASGYGIDSRCILGYLLCELLLDYNQLPEILHYEPCMHVGTDQAQIILWVPYYNRGLHAVVGFGSAEGFMGLYAKLYSLLDDILIEEEDDPLPLCPAARLYYKHPNCHHARGWHGGDIIAARTYSHVTAIFLFGLIVPATGPDFSAAADSMLDADGICRLLGLCTMVLSIVPEPVDATLMWRVLSDRI